MSKINIGGVIYPCNNSKYVNGFNLPFTSKSTGFFEYEIQPKINRVPK